MLIFDFDGVLMDSMDETLVTGYNAVAGSRVTTLDPIPGTVVKRFRQNRFHVRNSSELFALMEWCVAADRTSSDPAMGNGRLGQSEFESILGRSPLRPSDRSTQFFAARRTFMETDRNAWLALHRPYQPIWDELVRRSRVPILLLTSKNRAAVLELCAHFGMAVLPENVYSGDGGTDKTANLKAVHERFNRQPYRFIDDSLGNLRQLDADFNRNRRFIELMLAGWGYAGPGDAAEAERLGYRVLLQPTVMSLLG